MKALKTAAAIFSLASLAPAFGGEFAMPAAHAQRAVLRFGQKELALTIFAKSDGLKNSVRIDSAAGEICTFKSVGKTLKEISLCPYNSDASAIAKSALRDAFYILNVLPRAFENAPEAEVKSAAERGFFIQNPGGYKIEFCDLKKIGGKYAPQKIKIYGERYALELTLLNAL